MSNSYGLQSTRLLRPWDFPGKNTGVGCHCLLPSWWQSTSIPSQISDTLHSWLLINHCLPHSDHLLLQIRVAASRVANPNIMCIFLSWNSLPFYKVGLNSMWVMNFQMFKLVLEKAEEPEVKLPTSVGSLKKQESSGKTYISALLTMPKTLTLWITTNCGKLWKRREYQTTWPASWEICMPVRKQQLELDMEQ